MSKGNFHEHSSKRAGSVEQEAEREGKIQDIIAVMKSLMVEDAEGNEELARETLFKANGVANEARHWGELAKCWYHYFLDLEESKSCFFKALDLASAGPTVATVEYRTKEIAENGSVVRHVIGHRMVPTGVYLRTLFAAATCLQGETDKQLREMTIAETEAESLRSSLRSFGGFEFKEEDLLYFDKAESQLAWLHIARCWWEDFEERQQAVRCIARAEILAEEMANISNWVEVAKMWMRIMGEPKEAQRCVAQAESLLKEETAHEYITLAEGVAVLGDPELPVRYLDKAETLIDELSDWSAIAYTWEELGYFDRAERANNIADYLEERVDIEDYSINGGYGRYVPGEGPY